MVLLKLWLVKTRTGSGSDGGGIEQGTVSHVRTGATGDKGIRSGAGAGTIATTQGDNIGMGSIVVKEVGIVVGLGDWAICILHQGARWPCGHRHGHGTGGKRGEEEKEGQQSVCEEESRVVRCNKVKGVVIQSRRVSILSHCMQVQQRF